MCGIIGIAGTSRVTDRLISGLQRLEYRGYDSAGVAVMHSGDLTRRRAQGKIKNLRKALREGPIDGPVGIAHTRWATHGVPNETNAHPHVSGRVAIVHNGIIENYQDLRAAMSGRNFATETDSEVVAHLIDEKLSSGLPPKDAFCAALKELRGAYAFGVMIEGADKTLFAARSGSPLAIGVGQDEMYLGSDALALSRLTSDIIYLEEGDWAVVTPGGYEIYDSEDRPAEREVTRITGLQSVSDKAGFDHFMLKEIHEQPDTISRTLMHYIDAKTGGAAQIEGLDLAKIDRLVLVACGTASYAGDVAKYWFEQIAGISVEVDIASEFRYRQPVILPNTLFIAISQSGETADTLAAMRYCQSRGVPTAALVNVPSSTMAREADITLPTQAGPEIGVASTKAFTAQLTALAALAVKAGQAKGFLSEADVSTHMRSLMSLPRLVSEAIDKAETIRSAAEAISEAKHAFFLGRGPMVPIALEGALKLKEISYIHAEGYPAGELKHGPIALIEKGTPIVVIAPQDELFEKTVSNMQEVIARGANVVFVTDESGAAMAGHMAGQVIKVPTCPAICMPVVTTIAVQLFAYYAAVSLGTDVDQPRNLAKSVTVE